MLIKHSLLCRRERPHFEFSKTSQNESPKTTAPQAFLSHWSHHFMCHLRCIGEMILGTEIWSPSFWPLRPAKRGLTDLLALLPSRRHWKLFCMAAFCTEYTIHSFFHTAALSYLAARCKPAGTEAGIRNLFLYFNLFLHFGYNEGHSFGLDSI